MSLFTKAEKVSRALRMGYECKSQANRAHGGLLQGLPRGAVALSYVQGLLLVQRGSYCAHSRLGLSIPLGSVTAPEHPGQSMGTLGPTHSSSGIIFHFLLLLPPTSHAIFVRSPLYKHLTYCAIDPMEQSGAKGNAE